MYISWHKTSQNLILYVAIQRIIVLFIVFLSHEKAILCSLCQMCVGNVYWSCHNVMSIFHFYMLKCALLPKLPFVIRSAWSCDGGQLWQIVPYNQMSFINGDISCFLLKIMTCQFYFVISVKLNLSFIIIR